MSGSRRTVLSFWTLVTAAYADTRYKETFHLLFPSILHAGPDQAVLNPNNQVRQPPEHLARPGLKGSLIPEE